MRPDAHASVHGVLIDLDPSDLPALHAYEDISGGLYVREEHALRGAAGGMILAMVYLGGERQEGGVPPTGYMECVVAAAQDAKLPPAYVAGLAALLSPMKTAASRAAW